tara:strand:+ start:327 stop:6194 length:5868 start_codon:yes stop_codon:yes gene_type:complete
MPLSRLDNFLKNTRGNILYVNPNDIDATDSIENQGNSLTRPFKTIQRALIEASRFSYQRGLDNDRFGQTTILLYPGDHVVDNRPGWIPTGSSTFKLRNGTTSSDLAQFDLSTNFDLSTENNALYKLNSINGGVIIPRGTSIVGLDLRKTKIRPKYIPNPENSNIERSAIFRVTGGCYFWQFSILDGDPNGKVFKDYTTNTFVPNFSHHKLTCFEYADGVNNVSIDDAFLSLSVSRTDLDMYYEKVGIAYGPSSGREIEPDFPSSSLDIQPKIDEFRIVGPTGGEVGISSIKAGDGSTSSTVVTVTTSETFANLAVDTAVQINGITATGYDGQFVVSEVVSGTEFKYNVSSAPTDALPTPTGATVNLNVDTVTSASPYIFNVSLRSVFGVCGLHADGNKATGFKSMVIAQFTAIGLQKDDNAFVKYDKTSGTYKDKTFAGNDNLHSDSLAVYKPEYSSFHVKCSNNSVLQVVSVFAIGYAEHFVANSGGDQSITNSNSNFGAKSLNSDGYRRDAFARDDVGYITHYIPPKELTTTNTSIEFNAIDVTRTVGIASTNRLYLYNQVNQAIAPSNVIEGYRIGAKPNDELKCLLSVSGTPTEKKARIIAPDTAFSSNEVSYEKENTVGRVGTANSISSNVLTFTAPHQLIQGESIRFTSDTAHLPDGIENNRLYYAITAASGLGTDQIKVAQTLNDALNEQALTLNNKGGRITVLSRVSDKNSGDIGHPIQYDGASYSIGGETLKGGWYINVGTAATDNDLYSTIVSLGSNALGAATPRTFLTRRPDTRSLSDTVYRLRYVIPSGSGISSARPPIDGYVIQESGDTTGATDTEVAKYFSASSSTLNNVSELRNFKFISNATWSGGTATFETELPHNLSVGSVVEIKNVTSTNNTTGISSSGFNNTYTVSGITSTRGFTGTVSGDPGTFTNDTTSRTTSLPRLERKRYNDTYYVYRSQEVQKYLPGEQDGIYHLVTLNASNSPTVSPFSAEKFAQPVQFLYPQTNRDNPLSDPEATTCFAVPTPIGKVVVDDTQSSLTRETIEKNLKDKTVGFGITDIVSSATGTSHTIFTNVSHGYNGITSVSIASSGAGYGSGSAVSLYNAKLVSIGSSTTGVEATARIDVDASGGVTNVKIMDGGSAYGIGNTLAVVGVATTSGFSQAVLTVLDVYDNTGDVIKISGVTSATATDYNQLYRITGISTAKEIQVSSASTVSVPSTSGLGANLTSKSFGYLTGEALRVTSLTYDNVSGLATVVTAQNHGLRVDNKIRLMGANNDFYNKNVIVKTDSALNTFIVDVGIATNSPATSGTIFALREGVSSNDGNITIENENVGGRQSYVYAGITTTLSAEISSATTESIELTNVQTLNLDLGDYILIDDEIMRIKTTPSSNPLSVFRGVLGTRRTTHVNNSVVRTIRVNPVEFRRNSILRASGHTFEYVGYGPGNYSNALPDRQDRQLSESEEFLSQSVKSNGGVVVYTGMNDQGDFYIGNKKVSSATGQEEVFDAPIPSVTGEEVDATGVSIGFDVLTPLEASISRSLRVEGGTDNNIVSEFDGPVIFNEKLTSTSSKGVESNSLFLQGDATVSRKFTIGIATPSLAGNPGDLVFNANPTRGGYLGWMYTTENDWYRFGNISVAQTSMNILIDSVGIGTTTAGTNNVQVGFGTTSVFIDGNGNVGIATTNTQNYKLYINGSAYGAFVGDGSGLSNLDSIWQEDDTSTFVFDKDDANHFVGIGTSIGITAQLQVAGTAATSLYVTNGSRFISTATFESEVSIGGTLTSSKYRLISTGATDGQIQAGIVTSNSLQIGAGGTVFTANVTTSNVGIGTSVPRSNLDIEGRTRLKSYHENVGIVTSVSNVVTLDLSSAQNFTLTLDESVTAIKVTNIADDASSFTIKIRQDSTGGHTIGLSTFQTGAGTTIPVHYPGGDIVPGITTTAERSDIYTYKTFDGGDSFFGVVGGQNFLA